MCIQTEITITVFFYNCQDPFLNRSLFQNSSHCKRQQSVDKAANHFLLLWHKMYLMTKRLSYYINNFLTQTQPPPKFNVLKGQFAHLHTFFKTFKLEFET